MGSDVETLIWLYLAFFNLLALLLMYADKRFAQHRMRRIPESVLLMTAALGGSVGSWLGMRFFHHKTRKAKFSVGIPVIFGLQLILAAAVLLWSPR